MTITTAMRCKRPRCGCDEGAVAVEAAITFSALLLLLLGIIEFGTALWQWNTMELAVEQAGRYVMINNANPTCNVNIPSCAETQMQAILTNATVCTAPAAGKICVSASPPAGSPPTTTLTAKYNFNFLALAGAFTMTSQAAFPLD